MTRPRSVPPAHPRTSQLVSKANLRRRLKQATGARRVSLDTVDDAEMALELLAETLISCIRETYDDQLTSRRIQSAASGVPPALHPRHVDRALPRLPGALSERLKKWSLDSAPQDVASPGSA